MSNSMRNLWWSVIVSLSLGAVALCQADKDGKKPARMTVDEIVSRHLASIGTPDALASSKSRVMVGDGQLVSKLGASFVLNGKAQMASQGDKILYAMVFDSPVYPYEKVAFNGTDVSVGLPNGKRTLLAAYFKAQSSILKEGLFSGSLSTAWALLEIKNKKSVKLESLGTSKINNRQCYKIKYSSSSTGDLKIALYFDGETFRHVRTEYKYTIEGRIGTSSTDVRSASRTERYHLTEDFSDFKVAGKLTLPFTYMLNVTNELQIDSGTNSRDWIFTIRDVHYDEELKDGAFKVS